MNEIAHTIGPKAMGKEQLSRLIHSEQNKLGRAARFAWAGSLLMEIPRVSPNEQKNNTGGPDPIRPPSTRGFFLFTFIQALQFTLPTPTRGGE
jgi:hypothetical protein